MIDGIIIASAMAITSYQFEIDIQDNEHRYMQQHYGYKDNMADYLDYLKQHDIDSYMKLKPIYDNMHPLNPYNFVVIPFVWVAIVGIVILVFRGYVE